MPPGLRVSGRQDIWGDPRNPLSSPFVETLEPSRFLVVPRQLINMEEPSISFFLPSPTAVTVPAYAHAQREVIDATGVKTSPRMREVMVSLVQFLHEFARKVELTVEEWTQDVALPNWDADPMSSELVVDLPRHEDLEAFISQGKLAKLIRRGVVSIVLVDWMFQANGLHPDVLLIAGSNYLFGPAVYSVL